MILQYAYAFMQLHYNLVCIVHFYECLTILTIRVIIPVKAALKQCLHQLGPVPFIVSPTFAPPH